MPPQKKKWVKHQTLPPWLNTDIKQAMLLRNKCRKQKKFVEYKQQRNRVNYLVREAKKKYFNDLAGNKAESVCVCACVCPAHVWLCVITSNQSAFPLLWYLLT